MVDPRTKAFVESLPWVTCNLNDIRFGDQLREAFDDMSGAYFLFCNDKTGQRGIKIPRIKGLDETGTLYIGSGVSLIHEVSQLKIAVCVAAGNPIEGKSWKNINVHVCGKKFQEYLENWASYPFEKIEFEHLYVRAHWYPVKKLARDRSDWIQNCFFAFYADQFGELPLWNRNRQHGTDWMGDDLCLSL
jgi:hypothetical protein